MRVLPLTDGPTGSVKQVSQLPGRKMPLAPHASSLAATWPAPPRAAFADKPR